MAALAAIVAVMILAGMQYAQPIYFALIVYFSAICYISQYLVCRTLAKNPKKFPQTFMLVEFGKLFLHIFVLALYILAHRGAPADAKAFLVCFAVLFAIYLAFGTWQMHRIARKN